jgi:DNA-binding transcriptional MocR family regulator
MKLVLERASELPLYRQLAEQIREYIRSGALSPGTRLPTVRQIAAEHGITRLTVQTAFNELQALGLVESFVGRGSFVAEKPPVALTSPLKLREGAQPPPQWFSQTLFADMLRLADHPDLISMVSAIPEGNAIPLLELQRQFKQVTGDISAFMYGPAQGEPELREEIAHLLLDRGIVTSPDTVLITTGAQQGMDIVLRTLASPDEVLVVEEPTYPGIIELAAQRQQRVVGVPVDEEGLVLERLEEVCKTYHPRLVYTIPTFHNPTGVSLSAERRKQILQMARTYDFYLIEDDVYGFLAYREPAPLALKALDTEERVIYLLGFSKILAPGLRLGALVAGNGLLPEILSTKRTSDLTCSPILQRCLSGYLRKRHLTTHLQKLRHFYQERLDSVCGAAEIHLSDCRWRKPEGGLCFWVNLPQGINERDFYLEAAERGVGIMPGRAFFPQLRHEAYMRLSFGSNPPQRLIQGISLLGELLEDHGRRRLALASRAGRAVAQVV